MNIRKTVMFQPLDLTLKAWWEETSPSPVDRPSDWRRSYNCWVATKTFEAQHRLKGVKKSDFKEAVMEDIILGRREGCDGGEES